MNIKDITVIIINYRTEGFIVKQIEQIADMFEEIIVIDNSNSYSAISHEKVLKSPNVGFGTACNLAVIKCSKSHVLILNPDIKINKNNLKYFISSVCASMINNVCIPKVDKVYWDISEYKGIYFRKAVNLKQAVPEKINFASGAAMLLSKDVYSALGGFDEKIFMYCEDLDMSIRAKRIGVDLTLFPIQIGTHLGGGSFTTIIGKFRRLMHSISGHRYVMKKFQTEPLATLNSIFLALGIRWH